MQNLSDQPRFIVFELVLSDNTQKSVQTGVIKYLHFRYFYDEIVPEMWHFSPN